MSCQNILWEYIQAIQNSRRITVNDDLEEIWKYLLVTGVFINSKNKSMVFALRQLKFTEGVKLAIVIARLEVESTAWLFKGSLLSTAAIFT